MLEFFAIAMQIGVVVVALYAVTASHIVNRRLERERAAAAQREKELPHHSPLADRTASGTFA